MTHPESSSGPEVVGWAVPDWPHEPVPGTPGADAPTLTTEEAAYLTGVRQGPLRTVVVPSRWLRGAVHDRDGVLLPRSQKIGGLGGNQLAQADPSRVRPRADARTLSGTWLYGGHWIHHFGHFFTETVTALWPDRATLPRVDGLVFHRYFGAHRGTSDWQHDLLDLAGWGDLPVEVVTQHPVRVERLLLPDRSVVVNGWAHDGARVVWERMAASATTATTTAATTAGAPGDADRRVFVSRTAANAATRAGGGDARTSPERDAGLDAVFAAAGYDVVAPETLAVRDQVRLAAGASVLAGSAGTALHLSAFSPADTRVLELGDTRSPAWQVPQQQVVDRVRGHLSALVPHDVGVPDLPARLAALGIG